MRMVYARMGFAERLRALMAERGVSERALARQVVCDRSYIHLLKHGKRQPGARLAHRLAEALDAGGELPVLGPYKGPARRSVHAVAAPARATVSLRACVF